MWLKSSAGLSRFRNSVRIFSQFINMSSMNENIADQIKVQGEVVRKLKAEKAPAEKVGLYFSTFPLWPVKGLT